MSSPFHRLRQSYGDMSLQSKFTIVLILAVSIPVIMIGIFFYSRLYDMVVSYTIGQEQDSSSRTAPLIEERVQNVLDAYREITDMSLYQDLFHQPVNAPSQVLLSKKDAREFHSKVRGLMDGGTITGLQVYMDFPMDSIELFHGIIFRLWIRQKEDTGTGSFREQVSRSSFVPRFIWAAGKEKNSVIWHISHLLLFIISRKLIRLMWRYISLRTSSTRYSGII